MRLQQMIAAARATPWPHMANTDTIGLPNMGHPLGHVDSPMSVPVSAPSSVEAPPPPASGAVAGAVSWAPETAGADWGEMPTSAEIEAREAAARRAAADARLQTQLLEEQLAARRLQGELASAQQCHAIEQAELSERVRCSRRRVLTLAQHASPGCMQVLTTAPPSPQVRGPKGARVRADVVPDALVGLLVARASSVLALDYGEQTAREPRPTARRASRVDHRDGRRRNERRLVDGG